METFQVFVLIRFFAYQMDLSIVVLAISSQKEK